MLVWENLKLKRKRKREQKKKEKKSVRFIQLLYRQNDFCDQFTLPISRATAAGSKGVNLRIALWEHL